MNIGSIMALITSTVYRTVKSMFISCAQINCSIVFKIDEHEFDNNIFSIIMFEFRNKSFIFS